MTELIIIIQLLLLVVQVGCLTYVITTGEGMFDVLYGFAIWGCIPIALLGGLL